MHGMELNSIALRHARTAALVPPPPSRSPCWSQPKPVSTNSTVPMAVSACCQGGVAPSEILSHSLLHTCFVCAPAERPPDGADCGFGANGARAARRVGCCASTRATWDWARRCVLPSLRCCVSTRATRGERATRSIARPRVCRRVQRLFVFATETKSDTCRRAGQARRLVEGRRAAFSVVPCRLGAPPVSIPGDERPASRGRDAMWQANSQPTSVLCGRQTVS